ncbi:hypothetical protein GOP47_0005023 [Adiantum capillus-veneris]|uniref:Uncharacterized protein n=1 Tax=Adiantum capillus-veneris TaxID=13818 RepID=A0A9D4V4D6_ADICA|nr:hypothetical protein GOP47_0005023 [Adiantum capillus-veneris]
MAANNQATSVGNYGPYGPNSGLFGPYGQVGGHTGQVTNIYGMQKNLQGQVSRVPPTRVAGATTTCMVPVFGKNSGIEGTTL